MKTFTEEQMIQCYKDAVNNGAYSLINGIKLKTAEEYVSSIVSINSDTIPAVMPNFEPTQFDRNELESIGVFPKPIHKTSAEIEIKSNSETQNRIFDIPPKHINKPTRGIAVDCGSVNGKNPGKFEYRLVDIETKKVIINVEVPGVTTVNIAEFLAAVHGLRYVIEGYDMPVTEGKDIPVYSDSITAISWIRQRECKSKLNVTDIEQQKLIKESNDFLAKHKTLRVTKWLTHVYGEIPADYGNKSKKR